MSQQTSIKVTIRNRLGLHARPAMDFVDIANAHQSSVTVRREGQEVDGKSIMQMMMLAATKGTELEIIAHGPDSGEVCKALKELVDRGFDED